jgi:16S rRNA G966 N2-methylase RsmD
MRIIGGKLKGRTIKAPDGQGTRPTSDRARESLFNILAHADWAPALEGARVIDAFAGSGSLGFEAISRGAAFCLFVETEAAARGCIRDNVETFQLFGNTRIHRRSATDLGPKPAGLGRAIQHGLPRSALSPLNLDPAYTGTTRLNGQWISRPTRSSSPKPAPMNLNWLVAWLGHNA